MKNRFNSFLTERTGTREPKPSFEEPITRANESNVDALNVIMISDIVKVIVGFKFVEVSKFTKFSIVSVKAGGGFSVNVFAAKIREIFPANCNFLS